MHDQECHPLSLRAGTWFASVQWEREVEEPAPSVLPAVGIDMGVSVFAALSDGTMIAPGNFGRKTMRALRKAQRAVLQEQNGDDMLEPLIIPIPLSARVIYGMSLGVLPVWQMSASLKDVYSSKVEIAIKTTLLITLCGFFGSSAMLLYPNLGDSHTVTISITSIFVLGMMVVLGSSLHRFVKVRTGYPLIRPLEIRHI